MDPQPLNPPFNARVENGELWWELNERDNWHRDDNNKPPYKPGDTVRERECYRYDDRPTSCQGAPLESQVRVLYPDDPNWDEVDSLLPDGDPLRTIHPAETMPAWAIRPRVAKSIEPVMRDGGWWWRIGVETRSDP